MPLKEPALASSSGTRRSRWSGKPRPRRTSSGSTTTCTARTRSARCSSTSAAGGSAATTCSAASGRRSRSTGWPRTSTATSTRPPSRPTPSLRIDAHRVQRPLRRPGARATRRSRRRWAPTSTRSCRSTARDFADWWRDRLRARDGAQLRVPRGAPRRGRTSMSAGRAGRACSRTRSTSTTATGRSTGCSTSPSCRRRSNLRAVMEKTRGSVDEALLGRLQNSASDRNWDSIEALWRMKNEVRDDAELRAGVRGPTAAERSRAALRGDRARPPLHRRAGRALPARVRLARRLEPRVHLPDRPRADGARSSSSSAATSTTRLRLSRRRSRRCAATSRRPRARSSTG